MTDCNEVAFLADIHEVVFSPYRVSLQFSIVSMLLILHKLLILCILNINISNREIFAY